MTDLPPVSGSDDFVAAQGHSETCELLTVESSIKCTCGHQEAWMAAHTSTATVWLVEAGEYEQRGVFLVAESLDAAVAAIKRVYGPPYIVRWDELEATGWHDEGQTLTGHFEQVIGKSTKHTGSFDITPWTVERG